MRTATAGSSGLKEATFIDVSGYGQEEDRRLSQASGSRHHLVKPVDLDELVLLLTGPAAR